MRLQNLERIQQDHDFIYSTVDKTLRRQASHLYNKLIDEGKNPDEALTFIQNKYLPNEDT